MAAFNRGSLDVPANFFTNRTTFSLNGRSYESMLGGSSDDPLIRMLARGVAGYRTAAKALQYSLPGAFVTIESMSDADASGPALVSFRVEGQLRDGNPFTGCASLRLVCAEGELASINVICAEDDLARIAASRRA